MSHNMFWFVNACILFGFVIKPYILFCVDFWLFRLHITEVFICFNFVTNATT